MLTKKRINTSRTAIAHHDLTGHIFTTSILRPNDLIRHSPNLREPFTDQCRAVNIIDFLTNSTNFKVNSIPTLNKNNHITFKMTVHHKKGCFIFTKILEITAIKSNRAFINQKQGILNRHTPKPIRRKRLHEIKANRDITSNSGIAITVLPGQLRKQCSLSAARKTKINTNHSFFP